MLAAAVICQGFAVKAGEGQESQNSKSVGSKRLETLEALEGASVSRDKNETSGVFEYNHNPDLYQDQGEEPPDRGSRHFRGHWSGFEIGLNNYAYNRSLTLPDDVSYMKVDANSSLNLNFNFSQLSIGFSRHAGIVTGIGLNWNNYRFEHGNSIEIGQDEVIEPVYLNGVTPPVKRSKFGAIYLNVPALVEIQIPAGFDNHLNIAAGVVGGLRLNAWTKVVYEDKEKSKVNGDYNLNLLRGGVTARVGYQNFMIYGTYYLTPWFQESKGPNGLNLEPFEIGVAFTFND